jgi:hypothetical protein
MPLIPSREDSIGVYTEPHGIQYVLLPAVEEPGYRLLGIVVLDF